MAACFFNDGTRTHIISNSMSVCAAGFKMGRSYYNKSGDTLTYYVHQCGAVLARISRRRRQTRNIFYKSNDEANSRFKMMNDGKTFETGKWVPENKTDR